MSAQKPSRLLVLGPDVEIVALREFPVDIREQLGGDASDFIVSDRASRITSQRIAYESGIFLGRFRQPRRIVEAVFEHSKELGVEPSQVLSEIYPFVTALQTSAILIDPETVAGRRLGKSLSCGEEFEGYRLIERISGFAETEIFNAVSSDGVTVVIKHLRSGHEESIRENLRRETSILRFAATAGCAFVPRVRHADDQRDDPYIVLDWFEGCTLFDLIRRGQWSVAQRAQIVASLVVAYANLHRSGILHGDVHPHNVLILDDGSARLIDLGGAALIDNENCYARIGQVHYYEPEFALATLAGQTPPSPSPLGEQYCIAVLAYMTLTGSQPIVLSLETEAALSQIGKGAPRKFAELGLDWPDVESVLMRALNKEPAARFSGCGEFFDALLRALETDIPPQYQTPVLRAPVPAYVPANRYSVFEHCVRQFAESHGFATASARSGLPHGPKSSLYAGAAGVAYALLRVGCLHENAEMLASADVWISRALDQQGDSMAFTDGSVGAAAETGRWALFNSVTGLHAVQALIRRASGDEYEFRQAVTAFVRSVTADALDADAKRSVVNAFSQDATNGAASLLLGAALLLPVCVGGDDDVRAQLEALGGKLRVIVLDQLGSDPKRTNRLLGFAHGRTGAIYSLLRWAEVSGQPAEQSVLRYLDDLSRLARPSGDGLEWPIDVEQTAGRGWTGWCHGSAGHLLTWTIAARVLRRSDYLDLALAAGRHIWQLSGSSGPTLCCGSAGESLALFELGRASGDEMWIERGLHAAAQAVDGSPHASGAQGLFRSEIGVALAAAEAMEPATSAWPICQSPF